MQPVMVDAVVVGGGLAGLAAACALRAAGASVVVLEKRLDAGDPHRGDVLRPAAVDLLRGWGVTPAAYQATPVSELVVELEGKAVVHRRFPEAAPAIALPHPIIEQAIRDAARRAGVDVRAGWQLQALLQNQGGRVTGLTAVSSSDGAEFRAKVVVGADGRSSAVRAALGIRQRELASAYELVLLEAELAAGPAAAGGQVSVTYVVGAGGGGFLLPIGPRRVRVACIVERGRADAFVRQAVEAQAAELSRRGLLPLGARLDSSRARAYELTGSAHALNYALRGAVCVGDAAHLAPIPSPEGMHTALLDAAALGRHVGPALAKDEKAIDKALDRFERERWPDNEERLKRAAAAASWLAPLGRSRLSLARTPLARLALGALVAAS